jgi:hypothetical protein
MVRFTQNGDHGPAATTPRGPKVKRDWCRRQHQRLLTLPERGSR